jgi:polyisoprenoid-binding protein YceI
MSMNKGLKYFGKITRGLPVGIVLSASLFLGACTALITPSVKTEVVELKKGQYKIDPSHTSLIFKIEHLGLSTYVGRFNSMDATLDFDPENLTATKLNAIINTKSVDVNNAELEETLNKSSWFNTEQYPQASFETISVKVLSDSTFEFTGALTLRDVTAPVVLSAKFNGGANNFLTGRYTLGFSATAQIKRSDFGMSKYIGVVGDEVDLEIFAEFLRQ